MGFWLMKGTPPVRWDFEAVQCMGCFGQSVFDHDADAIALRDLDRWAGHERVRPGSDGFEGAILRSRFGAEAEDFCGAVEGEGEIGDVGVITGT